jgi:hypothetical protein
VAVAVSQGPLLATAFHPELTPSLAWHAAFARMAAQYQLEHARPAGDQPGAGSAAATVDSGVGGVASPAASLQLQLQVGSGSGAAATATTTTTTPLSSAPALALPFHSRPLPVYAGGDASGTRAGSAVEAARAAAHWQPALGAL